ncbi:RHS repeat-associated core domain-containing protein, partial [Propionicimonas sp.]
MSVLSRRPVVLMSALLVTIGMQQFPAVPAYADSWMPEVQQAASVSVKAAGAAKGERGSQSAFKPQTVTWPAAADATVDLGSVPPGQAVRAGSTPVRLAPVAGGKRASKSVSLEVLSREASQAVVGAGVVATVKAEPGSKSSFVLDYSGFAAAGGGGFASRLRLVGLPECALTTPEVAKCQQQTDLGSVNDTTKQELAATITAPESSSTTQPSPSASISAQPSPTPSTGTTTPPADSSATPSDGPTTKVATMSLMVVAAVAGESSDQGDYTQTSLKPSSSWAGGTASGQFTWSYPLRTPPVPGGLTPDLGISYASGGTDGGVANTNNQASWVGEGFELASGFIERKYVACADDKTDGNNSTSTGDQCWFTDSKKTNNEKWDNAFLSMDGHSGELVRDGDTANWRLAVDDGTRVAKIGSVSSNAEYWRVTTADGTQFFFGKGKADASTAADTNSKWSVPVAGNQSGEPGHASAFADSFDSHAWRWNLDYVVSPNGSTATYYYVRETNKYKKNLTSSSTYDRGGYLTKIQYGERRGAETNDDSPAKVTFTVEERCDISISSTCMTATPTSATTKAWPDVPLDSACDASYCPSEKVSPTFFSRKRVKQIDTFTRDAAGTAWEAAESWTLAGSFPKPADGAAVPSLWLASITHTGKVGTSIATPATTLTPMMLDSRISGGGVALEKPRLAIVTAETGAQTIVEYSHPECTITTVPTTAQIPTNTTRCMPVYYSSGDGDPTLQWFNKYVVTSVTDRDPVAQADVNLTSLNLDIASDVVTNYTYDGGGAWRYNDSPMVKAKYRTWGEWRGFGKVTTVVGSAATKTVTENTYFRGMNRDRANASGGTKTVAVTDSTGATWPDEDWFNGQTRESRTLTAVGGSQDTSVISDPQAETVFGDGRLTSRQVDVARTVSSQTTAGGPRVGIDRTLEWDSYGQPTKVESEGDTGVPGDETCTRTTYATPATAATDPINEESESSTMPGLCGAALDLNQVLSASRRYFGTAALGSITAPGLESKTEQLTGSGTNRTWTVTGRRSYDQWGRATQATDALGNVSTTSYTNTAGGLLTSMAATTADPDGAGSGTALTSLTYYETRLGAPIKSVAPGGQTTEASLDGLGRVIAVWSPGQSKATQPASNTYAYAVNKTAPSSVIAKALLPDGATYSTTITLLDASLRTRQVQAPSPAGGRLIADTRYDSRGNAVLSDSYYNSTAPNTTLVQPTSRVSILTSHRYEFDFAGRQTVDRFYSAESLKWQTATAYEGDRVKVTPPSGGTPTTTVSDIHSRTTQLIQHLGTTTNATGANTSYSYDAVGNLTTMSDAKGNLWRYTYDLSGNKLTSNDPDKGLSTMNYNIANQLTSTTDARGVTLKYFYDNLGRATKTTKADGTTMLTSTVYDTVKKGLVSSTSRHLDGGTITNRTNSYDSAGRATSSTVAVPTIAGLIGSQLAGDYTSTATYNADGSIKTKSLPAAATLPAETLAYGYTATGQANTLTGTIGTAKATYVTKTGYLQYGTISSIMFGTHTGKAIMASYTRDLATFQLTSTQLNRQVNPGHTDEHADITYDPAGNITQVKSTLDGGAIDKQCFSYDYLGQLTEAWTPNTATCDTATRSTASLSGPAPYWTSWATDITGKTTSRTDRTSTATSTTNYTYNADGTDSIRPHFVTGTTTTGSTTGTASYTADAAGNTISRPGAGGTAQTLSWDDQNQLTQVSQNGQTTARMVYDASGQRVLRQEAGATTLYLDGTELTLTGSGTVPPAQGTPATLAGLRYYSHTGQTIAVRTATSNDTVTTLIPDWQGTTHQQVVNATGQLSTVWQDPYGNPRGTPPATWAGQRGFVGGTKDTTGLTRIGARDYDPVLGRFITVDPVQSVDDPLQWNPYLYANN